MSFHIKLIKQNSNRSFIFNPLVGGSTIQQPNFFIESKEAIEKRLRNFNQP
jgi:hypothetical protein